MAEGLGHGVIFAFACSGFQGGSASWLRCSPQTAVSQGSSIPSANVLHVAWRCLLHWSVGPVSCLAGQVGRGLVTGMQRTGSDNTFCCGIVVQGSRSWSRAAVNPCGAAWLLLMNWGSGPIELCFGGCLVDLPG